MYMKFDAPNTSFVAGTEQVFIAMDAACFLIESCAKSRLIRLVRRDDLDHIFMAQGSRPCPIPAIS
jgi:hypothetical protein